MSKFHINKHGVPAPCRAKEGNCPLGGEESHFKTYSSQPRLLKLTPSTKKTQPAKRAKHLRKLS